MRISVLDLCGPICVDPDDGFRVCQDARQVLENGDAVELDFEGVTLLTGSFLNAAVGCLYGAFSADDLVQRLTWVGLDATDEAVLRVVQENAIEFFALNPAQRQRLAEEALSPVES